MTPEQNLPDLLQRQAVAPKRFDPRCAAPFVNKSVSEDAYLFQPHSTYRTLVFDKALSTRMVQKMVAKWGRLTGVGDVSPHDLRRTAITRALEMGQTSRQVQMMSQHRDPKTVMRYDHGRENLD